MLHANTIFWSRPSGWVWLSANIIECCFYFAVPIFVMISGALLLDYRSKYSTSVFMKKRFTKTVIPFLFWSLVSGIYISIMTNQPFDANPIEIMKNILNTDYFEIYWFFISLFALYLSIPLLSAVSDKVQVYNQSCIIGIVTISILPFIFSVFGLGEWPVKPPVFCTYAIYLLLGYVLANVEITKKHRVIIYILGLVGLSLHFFGTIYFSMGSDTVNTAFKGYEKLPGLLCSVAVFVFFKNINYDKLFHENQDPEHKRYEKTIGKINTLASCTLGVYLLHPFFVFYLPNTLGIDISSLWWRTAGAVIVFVLCMLITYLAKKIPVARNLLP